MNAYIHIPFCSQKCTYCKFAITPIFNEHKRKKYLHALKKEIVQKQELYKPTIETIYFGGGTPSLLSGEEISEILELFPKNNIKEISLESNPENINKDYMKGLLDLGINRISLGIQSLNSQTLKSVERQGRKSIISALESIKNTEVGKVILFGNRKISINIDFILGLPYSKKGEILKNIKLLHKNYNFITHTSVYILEKGLYPKAWEKLSISENEITEEYDTICQYFHDIGWNHYEVSNFCKPGYECLHNIGYWDHTDYLGFGLSASEFIKNNTHAIRNTNSLSFSGYYKSEKYIQETLSPEQLEIEKLLFGIRTQGYTYNEKYPIIDKKITQQYIQNGYLYEDDKKLKITQKGIHILDAILEQIII